jgi:hypothetical protein
VEADERRHAVLARGRYEIRAMAHDADLQIPQNAIGNALRLRRVRL